MLKSILVMLSKHCCYVVYSCLTAYLIKHFNRALNFFKKLMDKPWETLRVYS